MKICAGLGLAYSNKSKPLEFAGGMYVKLIGIMSQDYIRITQVRLARLQYACTGTSKMLIYYETGFSF